MSRIIVKNLPKYVAEDRLREFFSQKGEITDARLARTADRKSRQFGFIGFRTEHEANEAIKYFNNAYLDTSRITCEIALEVGNPNIPRSWSQSTTKKEEKLDKVGKKSKDIKSKEKGNKLKDGIEAEDSKLQEFLQVNQKNTKLWANEPSVSSSIVQNIKKQTKRTQNDKENPISLDTEVDKTKKEGNKLPESEKSSKLKSSAFDEEISDMDYLKSRRKEKWSDSESDDDDDDESDSSSVKDRLEDLYVKETGNKIAKEKAEEDADEEDDSKNIIPETPDPGNSNDVLETGRLFVRNLPYTATEEDLEELFTKFGTVSQVHLVVDKQTKRSKGFAYILYALPDSAARALETLDNSIFQGRLLHVMPAKPNTTSDKEAANLSATGASKTFKQKREDERKASESSGDTRSWNTLFMRPDTVVENIARKYGVSKSDLLDRETDDLAVRMALGETQVIAETKKALINAGINVALLEELAAGKTDGVKRSNHVILVKNLPYGSSEGELANMFGKFGSLDKIILPPTKTLALVVFLEAAEARSAFRGLAYKRYKDAPLYLEWAPGDILSQNVASGDSDKSSAVVVENDAKRVLLTQHLEGITDVDTDPDRVESRSLFVKNLNFKTSDESLRKHFTDHVKIGKILSVKVKKHMKNGKNVSMGFGFIEFDSVETATNVCIDLQGTILDGHALILQLCHAKKEEKVVDKVGSDRSSTKLIVRNVAFEATEKELRQLFSSFGQIKSLRLPMKFGNHRGFAFVEYVTKQEAQSALQALASTHLYGRHLVLERAKEGESLEELRARTAAQFSNDENGFQRQSKLSKKRKHTAILDKGDLKFEMLAQ